MRHIFITGGVCSGLGKGITAAALGRLLKQRGIKVSAQKLDPYMNVDPGTMSPFQHGEVFVTDDGAETDLDLGHYERFMDESLSKHSTLTSGQVYSRVLAKERAGGYLGGTVQVIPHVTEEIKNFIYNYKTDVDVLITEIGGTIGDIESQPFLEAIRQIGLEKEKECLFIHVTLVPYLKASGEHKSKPTQHSVKELRALGITPDIIVTRADEPISDDVKTKIALFSNIKCNCVIENITLPSLYETPLMLNEEGFDDVVCEKLNLSASKPDLSEWRNMIALSKQVNSRNITLNVAIVGKYVSCRDAYLSIVESLNHAGFASGAKVNIIWVDSENMQLDSAIFGGVDAIVVPGGFGDRGITGKIFACKFARENKIPFLGICLGMQVAVIEFALNVCNLIGADSAEFTESTPHPIIHTMPGQENLLGSGGTMRLGAYPCNLTDGSLLRKLYGLPQISERHRHRYELNNSYREILTTNGMLISGNSPDNTLAEAIELQNHPYFVGVQYHPEFKSRPNKPHPLFLGLLEKAINH
ncbi:MAG: CTP synthase [Firmicutes bacterium]|nr:CTP synthase [Bacillota bacterium]